MHFPVVHPGTLTDKDERQNGRPQVYFVPHPSSINNSCHYSVLMITLGQVIAYAIGAGFFHVKSGWRWMVGLGAVPAGIQFLLLFFLPESRTFHHPLPSSNAVILPSHSPRPLTQKKHIWCSRSHVQDLHLRQTRRHRPQGIPFLSLPIPLIYIKKTPIQKTHHLSLHFSRTCFQIRVLNAAVQRSIRITQTTTFYDRAKSMLSDPINRRALAIGCGMQAFQQLCGFNTLMYYSATLFAEIGFNQPTAVGLIISGTNFLFTLIALKWIDSIGRRRIMLISAPGMIVGLVLASVAFHCTHCTFPLSHF